MKPRELISVLIVDDNPIIRTTLKMVLEKQKVFRVVAQSSNCQQGIDLYQNHNPDIVLTDMFMKDCNALKMCQKIIKINPLARIIVLSGVIADDEMLISALKAGISGYLTKTVSIDELTNYLLASMIGEKVFTPYIQRKLSYISTS